MGSDEKKSQIARANLLCEAKVEGKQTGVFLTSLCVTEIARETGRAARAGFY